ncbi:MAG TPA: thiol reductant ABC exporter subunit CydD [Anaerolineaceae bacterium]|nr:thiol reductant ABC exporter subunit CydD [Anaerolineaceae bacterium]
MNLHRRLLDESRRSGIFLPLAILFGFLAGGLAILQSYRLSQVLKCVFIEHQTLQQVVPVLRIILLIVLLRVLFTFLNEFVAGRLAVFIKLHLREQLVSKIQRLGSGFLHGEKSAELTTTALQGVEALDAYFSQYLPQVLLAGMLPLTILLVVFPLDIITGIVFLVTAPLIPVFMILIGWMSEARTRKQWNLLTRLSEFLLDTLQGIAVLKALGRSRGRIDELQEVGERYREATLSVLRFTFLSALTLELIATISTAVVAVEIGLRLLYGQLEFQQAFFILLIAPDFYLPLRNLSARYHAGMSGVTAARRIYEVLDLPEQIIPEALRTTSQIPFQGSFILRLSNVSYTYPDALQAALSAINFEFQGGRQYVLVGKSGSGKTTLAKLLLRLLNPEKGSLELDGMDASAWELEPWRERMAWVPQKPFIFNTSLLHNLTLGKTGYSRAEIDNALEMAGLTEVVQKLPLGLETPMLEGGARLSGGEAQRLAIARAFLRNPAFLMLDEPTAHLDVELERVLTTSIRKLMSGRTSLTIAHRYSTLVEADEIILMESGRILDHGRHDALLTHCPSYRDLVSRGSGPV